MKKSLIVVAIGALTLGVGAVTVGAATGVFGDMLAENTPVKDYTITLNKTITLDGEGLGSFNSTTGYQIPVKATNYVATTKVVSLDNNGTFENIGEVKGLKSISVTYKVNDAEADGLTIDYGFNLMTGEKRVFMGRTDVLKSGVAYTFDNRLPSFFKLTATSNKVEISAITMEYSCVEKVETTPVDLAKYYDFNAVKPVKDQNASYYTFDGLMGGRKYEAEKPTRNQGGKLEDWKVGYMSNSTLEYDIHAARAEKVLVTGNFSSAGGNALGYKMNEQYTLVLNDQEVDISKTWINGTNDWNYCITSIIGEIELKPGLNTIKFISGEEKGNFDYFQFVPAKAEGVATYNYKPGMSLGANEIFMANCELENNTPVNAGWIGETTYAEFNLKSVYESRTGLFLNGIYDNGDNQNGNPTRYIKKITVNGKDVDFSKAVIADGGEGSWWERPYTISKLADINIEAGYNNIKVEFAGKLNFRAFQIGTAELYEDAVKIEAEDTAFSGLKGQRKGNAILLGEATDKSTMTFSVDSLVNGKANLAITCASKQWNDGDTKIAGRISVIVNGVEVNVGDNVFNHTGMGNEWWQQDAVESTIATIDVKVGINTIVIKLTWDINTDFLTVTPIV